MNRAAYRGLGKPRPSLNPGARGRAALYKDRMSLPPPRTGAGPVWGHLIALGETHQPPSPSITPVVSRNHITSRQPAAGQPGRDEPSQTQIAVGSDPIHGLRIAPGTPEVVLPAGPVRLPQVSHAKWPTPWERDGIKYMVKQGHCEHTVFIKYKGVYLSNNIP